MYKKWGKYQSQPFFSQFINSRVFHSQYQYQYQFHFHFSYWFAIIKWFIYFDISTQFNSSIHPFTFNFNVYIFSIRKKKKRSFISIRRSFQTQTLKKRFLLSLFIYFPWQNCWNCFHKIIIHQRTWSFVNNLPFSKITYVPLVPH